MHRVCVYLGSRTGTRPEYSLATIRLGRAIAELGLELVYGAGAVGLMGVLSREVVAAGGRVIGVIPSRLVELEGGDGQVGEVRIVDNMHQRKADMAQLSDAFVAMPGGLGTLEEFFETLTWAQLGYHDKPIGMLNVGGYFDPLLEFLDHSVAEGFVSEAHRHLFTVDDDAERLLRRLMMHAPASTSFDESMT